MRHMIIEFPISIQISDINHFAASLCFKMEFTDYRHTKQNFGYSWDL